MQTSPDHLREPFVKDAVFDQKDFRATMGQFCTGVVIATGAPDGVPAGVTMQSFVSLSLDPPLVAICPAKTSTSWPRLREAGAFGINLLHAGQVELCDRFARSGGDKFAELNWRPGTTGAPILNDALAWIECTLENEMEAGDHTIAVGRVQAYQRTAEDASPLLFFRGQYGEFAAIESSGSESSGSAKSPGSEKSSGSE